MVQVTPPYCPSNGVDHGAVTVPAPDDLSAVQGVRDQAGSALETSVPDPKSKESREALSDPRIATLKSILRKLGDKKFDGFKSLFCEALKEAYQGPRIINFQITLKEQGRPDQLVDKSIDIDRLDLNDEALSPKAGVRKIIDALNGNEPALALMMERCASILAKIAEAAESGQSPSKAPAKPAPKPTFSAKEELPFYDELVAEIDRCGLGKAKGALSKIFEAALDGKAKDHPLVLAQDAFFRQSQAVKTSTQFVDLLVKVRDGRFLPKKLLDALNLQKSVSVADLLIPMIEVGKPGILMALDKTGAEFPELKPQIQALRHNSSGRKTAEDWASATEGDEFSQLRSTLAMELNTLVREKSQAESYAKAKAAEVRERKRATATPDHVKERIAKLGLRDADALSQIMKCLNRLMEGRGNPDAVLRQQAALVNTESLRSKVKDPSIDPDALNRLIFMLLKNKSQLCFEIIESFEAPSRRR